MAATSIARKLLIKPNHKILILNAPDGYLKLLDPMPEDAQIKTKADGAFDCVQAFVYNKADVEKLAQAAIKALKPGGLLWMTYPKKTSKIKTDISRDTGWEAVREQGMEGVALIAIDGTWSAMRFRPASDVRPRSKA
jgi:hypothetical protein